MRSAGRSSTPEQALDPNDITLLAADRLEAALERLADALEAREMQLQAAHEAALRDAREAALAEARAGLPPAADAVSRADIERLSARLDEALGRLRALVGDDSSAEL
jgi:small-conductance mechanosensitive channel